MRRETSITEFDRFFNKIIASACLLILSLSTISFLIFFFYQDIQSSIRNFKTSMQEGTPVFEETIITVPKNTEQFVIQEQTFSSQSTPMPIQSDDIKAADKIFVAYELRDTALASKLIADFLVEYPESKLQNRVRLIGAKIMNDKLDYDGALAYVQKILNNSDISNKDYSESVLLLGEIARKRKQYDSYIQSFLEQAYFKAEEPVKSKLAFYLGYLFLNKGDYQNSLSYFNNVIGEDGVLGRADLYSAQIMHPETINALENFLTQYQSSKNYDYAKNTFIKEVHLYSKTLSSRGYLDNAQKVLEKIIKIFPTSKDADLARLEIANIYYDRRQFDKSAYLLSQIIENKDRTYNPDALFMLGTIAFEKNQQEQALGFFRSLIDQYPDSKLVGKAKQWKDLILESLRN